MSGWIRDFSDLPANIGATTAEKLEGTSRGVDADPFCWRSGVVVSGVRRMNEVNARRARLVPGRVTVFGWVYHLGM